MIAITRLETLFEYLERGQKTEETEDRTVDPQFHTGFGRQT
jgi:hypothetical protein